MRTAAILPIKRFSQAKQRLGESVADPLRRELAEAMVSDVLLALSRTRGIETTFVVTCEPRALCAAERIGATVVADRAESGQSAAVAQGIASARQAGFERVLCVPGDCPALDPGELEALLTSAERDEVVILPDRHGTGTNGLLLSPPDAVVPSFGPDSCKRHGRLAAEANRTWRVQRLASLLFDVDTGADLTALRSRLSGEDVPAARTRAVLGEHGLAGSVRTPA